MKVAMFSRGSIRGEGGTATYVRNIVRRLPRYQFLTFTPDNQHANDMQFLEHVQELCVGGSAVTLEEYQSLGRDQVRAVIDREDIDVFHAHNPITAIELARAAPLKKIVVTHHGSRLITPFSIDARARELYDEYIEQLSYVSAVVTHSPLLYPRMKSRGIPVHYAPIGADYSYVHQPDRILDIALTPKKYNLFMGKLVPEKGVDTLIRSYADVDTQHPLVIAGNSQFNPHYAANVKEMAAKDHRIRFLGEVSGALKHELYTFAYTLVNPLRVIGLPLVVLEAMGHGTCVINTDHSLCHDAIRLHSLHFSHQDTANLSSVIQHALDNPSLVQELGNQSQEYVRKHHSWETVAQLYERLYQQ